MAAEGERPTWSNKLDFLCACVGFSVGLGNVWRFPYLCYKHGGGAFLIPYFICVIVGGVPLFFLEVAVGQFMSRGGVAAWRLCPILKGIGWSTTVVVFFLNCYYCVILAWAFHYLFASLTSQLPWTACRPEWANCTTTFVTSSNGSDLQIDPTTSYWENRVLKISGGIDEPGRLDWELGLCLLLAWVVVYACICKGIKTSGKVMYVTATAPYVLLLVLLVRNALLAGSLAGVTFYVRPDFARLGEPAVWADAGTQIFFSYSVGLGALTALGSYNKFRHNSYRDSIIFAATNSGTSVLAGFVIFTILGHMAHEQKVAIQDVAESGPGLAFIAYPKAVAQMPAAPVWSVCFFLMLILLGLDSQFVGVEGLVTAVTDSFPQFRVEGRRRYAFIAALCFAQFVVGLSMVTNGGMYVFQLFDYYSGSRIILLIGLCECVAVGYLYGISRFYDNLEMMLGFRISPYMGFCWVILSPIFCLSIFIMSIISYSELTYDRPRGQYTYPGWSVALGWMMAAFSAIWIPIYAIRQIFTVLGNFKPWRMLIEPEDLEDHQLRPQDRHRQYSKTIVDAPPTYSIDKLSVAADVMGIEHMTAERSAPPCYSTISAEAPDPEQATSFSEQLPSTSRMPETSQINEFFRNDSDGAQVARL